MDAIKRIEERSVMRQKRSPEEIDDFLLDEYQKFLGEMFDQGQLLELLQRMSFSGKEELKRTMVELVLENKSFGRLDEDFYEQYSEDQINFEESYS